MKSIPYILGNNSIETSKLKIENRYLLFTTGFVSYINESESMTFRRFGISKYTQYSIVRNTL